MTHPRLTYYPASEHVLAFSTTRHGGVSQGNYTSFNVNAYCGDDPGAVEVNRRLLCDALHVSADRLVMPHQVHATEVRRIDETYFSLSASDRQSFLEGVDAVMTSCPEVCIGVSTADCIPVLIYDPSGRACAAVHAGWRGTVARITAKTVAVMCREYGIPTGTLHAVVGPGISLKRFEVGDEVYDAFHSAGFDMRRIARREEKWHIDLPMCNLLQLTASGLNEKNVQMTDICTYDEVADYFSARRLGIASGRIFSGICLQDTARQ